MKIGSIRWLPVFVNELGFGVALVLTSDRQQLLSSHVRKMLRAILARKICVEIYLLVLLVGKLIASSVVNKVVTSISVESAHVLSLLTFGRILICFAACT